MRDFFIKLLSGADNQSADVARVSLLLTVCVVLGLAVAAFWRKGIYDPVTLCSAIGGLIVAVSGAILIKKGTEPQPKAPKNDQAGNVSLLLIAFVAAVGIGFALGWVVFDKPAEQVTRVVTVEKKVPVNVPVAATVAPQVKTIDRVEVRYVPKTVTVYADSAKKALKLPTEVQANASEHVLTSSLIAPDDHPVTLTTTLDVATGKSQAIMVREPLPWLAKDMHGDISVAYGLKGGARDARVEVRQNLFDVKAVRVGLVAAYDQPVGGAAGLNPERGFVGVMASYRY